MTNSSIAPVTTLFIDIGEVILTNGWDTNTRERAAQWFHLDFDTMETRHRLFFDLFESGKITMENYLENIVFYEKRAFTITEFQQWIFEQSKPYPDMIKLIIQLKKQYQLTIAALSNEPREINRYRIQTFKLHDFIDYFISSCYVHLRKPDIAIFKMALDIAQTPAHQILYIDDRALFIPIAESLGIQGLHHEDYVSTRQKLATFGLISETTL